MRALDYLSEQKWLELKTAGVRQKYHLRERPLDHAALVKTLYTRVLQRESREIERCGKWRSGCSRTRARLPRWPAFRRPAGAAVRTLLVVWRGGKAVKLALRIEQNTDPKVWSQAEELRRQYIKELGPPRAFARFLCGVSSPWLVKAKLQQNRLFGSLVDVPFGEVLCKASGLHPCGPQH